MMPGSQPQMVSRMLMKNSSLILGSSTNTARGRKHEQSGLPAVTTRPATSPLKKPTFLGRPRR